VRLVGGGRRESDGAAVGTPWTNRSQTSPMHKFRAQADRPAGRKRPQTSRTWNALKSPTAHWCKAASEP
jgi:hypothetical protein